MGKDKKKIVKSYIFCYCFLTPELVDFFYNIEGVINFLNHKRGENKLPDFYPKEVIKKFFIQIEKNKENIVTGKSSDLKVGDLVRITGSMFPGSEGKIIQLDEKKGKVKVEIEFMERAVFVDISINECQKLLV